MKKTNCFKAILLLLFAACKPAGTNEQRDSSFYFDLKGYVQREAVRLQQQNQLISKTVSIGTSTETKGIKIKDWSKELSLLADVDINKVAWKGLFIIKKSKDQITYTCDQEKVPVKQISVRYRVGIPREIFVLLRSSNLLYTSSDSIYYCPDSLYQIHKNQQIKLLPEKNYRVILKFN